VALIFKDYISILFYKEQAQYAILMLSENNISLLPKAML
jgi:hypothetical protein